MGEKLNRLVFIYPVILFIFLLVSLITVTHFHQETLLSLGKLLTVQSPLQKADALVLLAGENRTRVPATARLFRNGFAPAVLLTNDGILSGWSDRLQRNLYAIEWTEEELVRLGVPRQAIVKLPFQASGTIYDALMTNDYVAEKGINKLLIVTSDYHSRRSLWTFKTIMPDNIELAVFAAEAPSQAGNLGHRLFVEYVKLVYYIIRYGVFPSLQN